MFTECRFGSRTCQDFSEHLCIQTVYDGGVARKRTYTKTLRAESEESTRQRIVDALVELHEELGPSRTTVSAVAERAGVQRLTVYRHFPDEPSMIRACSAHWAQLNPLPDLAPSGADPLR